MMTGLVPGEFIGVNAAVSIQVEVRKYRHLLTFSLMHSFAATVLFFTHRIHVGIPAGREFRFIEPAIAVTVDVAERWRTCGTFHLPSLGSTGRHAFATYFQKLFLADEAITVYVKILKRRRWWAM